MFETLLSLPLFQGLSRNDLTHILEKVSFNFRKLNPGDLICEQGSLCESMLFLLDGQVCVKTTETNRQYTLLETVETPGILQPEILFGLHPAFTHTFSAKSTLTLLEIPKGAILTELFEFEIFRLNFMNNLCSRAQLREKLLRTPLPSTVTGKFAQFLFAHMVNPMNLHNELTLKAKIKDLAVCIQAPRLNVSNMLRTLRSHRLITHSRGIITIVNPSLLTGEPTLP